MDMPALLEDIVKVDEHTITFKLNRPEALFLANMAMDLASILSAEYAAKLEAEGKKEMINQQPAGTGPFQSVDYQKDAVNRYAAHPDFWSGKRPVDDLIFANTTDASVRMQKLKTGERRDGECRPEA